MEFIDYVIYGPTALAFLVFLFSYLHDRRKVSNGFLFLIFLFFALVALTYAAFTYNSLFLTVIIGIIFLILIFFAIFGGFIIAAASIWNARILIRREGFKTANLLTLLLGIGTISLFFIPLFDWNHLLFPGAQAIVNFGLFIAFYFAFHFVIYLMASFLYHWYRPRYNKDYVIVLGSGLIQGYIVSPLLQSRIFRAIDFYHKQEKATGQPPILVFSGGQGPDEHLSEAEAMRNFAVEQGIPIEQTRMEDQSTTTFENMKFSKALIEEEMNGKKYRALFSTNNYHVFRAGIYAKWADFDAQGIGGKTALYYWPNAMLREFIAVVVMHKKNHFIFIAVTALLYISFLIISRLLV